MSYIFDLIELDKNMSSELDTQARLVWSRASPVGAQADLPVWASSNPVASPVKSCMLPKLG